MLFDAVSAISCIVADWWVSEKFVELKSSECLNEMAEFSKEIGNRG